MTSSATIAPRDQISAPALRAAVSGLPAYVAGRRSESALAAALASNESHYAPLPSVIAEVQAATQQLNRYPDIAATELRERIAGHVGVTLDEITVGPGSVGVLQQIVTSVCDHDDEVVFAWRSFEAYPILVGLAGARSVPIPLLADDGHDLAAMAAAITDRTRLVILCSPNNPTGTSIPAAAMHEFLAQVPPSVLVVIDEAYLEYMRDPAADDALEFYRQYPNVCVLRTFSKAYGLAGLRVGYAVASPVLARGLRSAAIPFGVSTIAQRAAIASLDATDEMRERVSAVTSERARVTAAVRGFGWRVPDSQANFIWIRTGSELRRQLVEAFTGADVLVRAYADDGIRITLADPSSNDRVLAVLAHRARFASQS
jgi:histidinol-phosphate aminotransferase